MDDSPLEGGSESSPAAAGVADELLKLAQLRDSGILSEQEFAQQKQRLLGGGVSAGPRMTGQSAVGVNRADQPVTWVKQEQWNSSSVVLRSDGDARAFLDVIAAAIEAAQYPITDRSYADLRLTFESRGISYKSWSGDVTTVMVTAVSDGSKATFTSKGKPSGAFRLQMKADARTWVARIVPGFGELWRSDEAKQGPWMVQTRKGKRRAAEIRSAADEGQRG